MVRDAHRRIKKYEKNIDPDQTKRKLERLRGVMIDLETPYLAQIAEIERKVKRICERQGVATHLIAQYINFARQVYSKSKRFSSVTLNAEIQNLVNLWTSRGLLGAKLIEIAGLFGVTPTAPPALDFNPVFQYPTLPVMSPINGYFPSHYWYKNTGATPPWTGDIFCIPMPVLRRLKIDRLAVFLNGLGVGGNFRLALYDDNGHLYPNSILEDSGVFPINAGLGNFYTYTVDRWLDKDMYWLAFQISYDTASMFYSEVHPPILGIQTGPMWWINLAIWQLTQAFGAFPDPFPAWIDPNVWWDNYLWSVAWRIAELG